MDNDKTTKKTITKVDRYAVLTVTKEFTVHPPYSKPRTIPIGAVEEAALSSFTYFNDKGDYVIGSGHGLDYCWPADCFTREDFEVLTEETTVVTVNKITKKLL
jgi:hypothetical protein